MPAKRTRMTPVARRSQLLDTARHMIREDGLQAFAMEALARAAGVSSPLVYNYFASRSELLRELLAREYDEFAVGMRAAIEQADGFEDILRLFVTSNFDHLAPGNILPILQSQPELASVIKQSRRAHGNEIARFLVRTTRTTYRLSTRQAQLVVGMSSGASTAAAEWANSAGLDRDETVNAALTYILAGIDGIVSTDLA